MEMWNKLPEGELHPQHRIQIPEFPDTSWREQALCRDADPEIFFDTVEARGPNGTTRLLDGPRTREARWWCFGCPVQEECLQFAVHTKQDIGIWGGANAFERYRLRTGYVRGRSKANVEARQQRKAARLANRTRDVEETG